jgi:hypothetical protein
MMREGAVLDAARRKLEEAVRAPVDEEPLGRTDASIDALFRVGDRRLAVELKSNARSATVSQAVARLRKYREQLSSDVDLLLVVPRMGDVGAQICEREGVNWIDLRGNASIELPQIRVFIGGRRDDDAAFSSYSDAESGINPFSKKASRITHAFLLNPRVAWTRSDLQNVTGLDKGYVSKILAELVERRYLEQSGKTRGAMLRVVDPIVLLDAWRERYKPERPAAWGLVASRNGEETVQRVTQEFSTARVQYALTGLAAAADYAEFGSFRRVDVYLADSLPKEVAALLNVGPDQRGRNVALYIDRTACTIGPQRRHGVTFASPVLTYMDLAHSPERSTEAAEEMRRYLEHQWK